MSEPKVLLSGLRIPESPGWHEGRLWFCNWIDRPVVAIGLDARQRWPRRPDRQAIRLERLLHRLLPEEGEVAGLQVSRYTESISSPAGLDAAGARRAMLLRHVLRRAVLPGPLLAGRPADTRPFRTQAPGGGAGPYVTKSASSNARSAAHAGSPPTASCSPP
jgi:hypothetical protein